MSGLELLLIRASTSHHNRGRSDHNLRHCFEAFHDTSQVALKQQHKENTIVLILHMRNPT